MIYDSVRLDPLYGQLAECISLERKAKRCPPLYATGVGSVASVMLCAALAADFAPLLVLAGSEREAARITSVLNAQGLPAAVFLERDPVLYNIAASRASECERLSVLLRLMRGELKAVVAVPGAALGFTVPPALLREAGITLRLGEEYPADSLEKELLRLGYARCEMTEAPGQFARRGGILDVFPAFGEGERGRPVRVEFFGDEVDRIGLFDPDTQRTEEGVSSVFFPPARELLLDPETVSRIRLAVATARKKAKTPEAAQTLDGELAAIDGALPLDFADKYITLVYPEKTTLLDYFPAGAPVAVAGGNAVRAALDAALWHEKENVTALLESGVCDARWTTYMKDQAELELFCAARPAVYLDAFLPAGAGTREQGGIFSFRCRSAAHAENRELLFEDIEDYLKSGYRIVAGTASSHESETLAEMLRERGCAVALFPGGRVDCTALSPQVVYLTDAPSLEGFELTDARFVFLSLSSAAAKEGGSLRRARRKKRSDAKQLLSYADLKVGDYVVHETCGIGRYLGIEQLTVDGVTRDYINIQYAGSDKLFIPTNQLDMVSKYIGAHSDDGLLKLSKMGGAEWKHAKSRAKSAVSEMAKELIKLYAERMRLPGFAFPADDDYQREFEEAFPYEETDSQLEAAEEIKADMQQPHPMDRLLCGDVGYGKTEVAFRAAFKAVEAGKQVAILCPTTILAYQHYTTAAARMRDFPIRIEMLSRFRTPARQKEILRRLKRGDIDIIIGTHTLVYGKAEFKDLGLLVIDEEQRFGVAQKEKLKQLSAGVDVLMLSATPIPRTLNMAIGGIRDMSVLDEPPGERRPVQTYVLEYDPVILEDAIRREISRGGQVFYLYNRVERINTVAARLAEAIPGARVAVAHGQMDKDEVEDVWRAMLSGEVDVLVSTSIIETGVDVPNANTLIIEDADRMGLSQLHQLRGRVGRSGRRAFAYFTFRRGKALSEIAEKRLSAIREYAQFGAGFRVALRDLEIRGAGNMLGAEQHGHLDAVGYDLYMKLLSEAVLEEKGVKKEEKTECVVDLRVDAFLPESYVSSQAQRIEQYQHIATIRTKEDADDIEDAMQDRYGDLPQPVSNLIRAALIKAACEECGFTRFEQQGRAFTIHIPRLVPEIWMRLFSLLPEYKLRGVPGSVSRITAQLPQKVSPLDAALRLLDLYREESAALAEKRETKE